VGEFVSPGMPLVLLGDTSAWLLVTDNLTDVDIVKLKPGDIVEVTLDAFPMHTRRATVQHIQPASEIKRGDVTYAVTLALDAADLPLLWGMRAAIRLY
jgi:multidrug resistance efflux pump